MPGQDFAHNESPRPEDVRPAGQMKVLLLTLLALLVVAGGFSAGFYLGQEMGMEKASSENEAKLLAQLKQQQQELARLRAETAEKQPEVSTTQVGELTFYNELPKQSVEPVPMESQSLPDAGNEKNSSAKPAAADDSADERLRQIIEQELGRGSDARSAKPVPEGGGYFLQLASFQKKSEAEQFLPKLDAAGYQGSIRRVELSGLGVWYRVYAGPFPSKLEAEQARRSAKEKLNITGLVVKGG